MSSDIINPEQNPEFVVLLQKLKEAFNEMFKNAEQ